MESSARLAFVPLAWREIRSLLKRRQSVVRLVHVAYGSLNWLRSRPLYCRWRAPFLGDLVVQRVLFSNRGNHPAAHLRRTCRYVSVRDSRVLVAGCGSGGEMELWANEGPALALGFDLRESAAWSELKARTGQLHFMRADAREMPFSSASFDIVASTAFFEHVLDVGGVLDEVRRVLRPGGLVFANAGPLYHSFGGAHYQGAYDHLLLSQEEFVQRLRRRGCPEEVEGLYFLERGLFSRWTFEQYVAAFTSRFDPLHWTVAISPEAMRYRRAHPEIWRSLAARFGERNLLVSGFITWCRRPPGD